MSLNSHQFSARVLKWFAQYGRKNLPWQQFNSPYHVWLSEIMLQQTQVATVIPYFQRFIKKFPDLKTLAEADIDDVLALWAGLGYYARARHLHRTAKIIMQDYQGRFPRDITSLQQLPGIGRSTAGAILALSMRIRAPILDGNVKRVLARFHAIDGWPGANPIMQQLWEIAERYTPQKQVAEYTQAMMDLGATLCTRSQPNCQRCPLQTHCKAYAQGNPTAYPMPKPRKTLPVKTTHMLLLLNQNNEILLVKRPPAGVWGGLWSLPECPVEEDVKAWSKQHFFCDIDAFTAWPPLRHTFSHFHLDIVPIQAIIKHWQPPMMEPWRIVWYNIDKIITRGVAAPVKLLLQQLAQSALCPELSTARNFRKKPKA